MRRTCEPEASGQAKRYRASSSLRDVALAIWAGGPDDSLGGDDLVVDSDVGNNRLRQPSRIKSQALSRSQTANLTAKSREIPTSGCRCRAPSRVEGAPLITWRRTIRAVSAPLTTLDPGVAALLGALVGGVASLFATAVTLWGSKITARRKERGVVAAAALLVQDDFIHSQVTLARALDRY